MKSEAGHAMFSVFDSLEHLQIASSSLLSKCDKKLSKQLVHIFQQWERLLNYLISEKQNKDSEFTDLKEKYCQSKNIELKLRIKLTQKKSKEAEMIKEIQAIKDHLEEGKDMWAKHIKKIEEVMQEQERSKQKIESLYQQRLAEIDAELDDIMHIHKNKLEVSQKLGDILPALFSQEELMEEEKIALGEISERKIKEFHIRKLENASNFDINSENSVPEMNLEDLKGTQKQIFQRLLDLRKKMYRFKHDDTACSENSLDSQLPSELKSMSDMNLTRFCNKLLSKTVEMRKKVDQSIVVSQNAGIIFGMSGSEKYRAGLTDLIKSDKLSISERENIVYKLINGELPKGKTVANAELIHQENWGDVSSIHCETKEAELSQDLQNIFSKGSISLSKASFELNPQKSKAGDFFENLDNIFSHNSLEINKEKPIHGTKKEEVENSKDQECSSMSILKEFSRNISMSSRRKNSDDSRKEPSILEPDSVVSNNRKFSLEQREPSSSFIIPPNTNLYFMPEPVRPRSNPRVVLKPEENFRSRDTSLDSNTSNHKVSVRTSGENSRKPISMVNKLPILPQPPAEAKKITIKSFRGRSLQPIQNQAVRVIQSPPTRKITGDAKSTSPGIAIKFRMRRFKEAQPSKAKVVLAPSKPLLNKRNLKS